MGVGSTAAALCLLTILVVNNLGTAVAFEGIKVQLVHRDHEKFVTQRPNVQTLHERQHQALVRGKSQHRRISRQLFGSFSRKHENDEKVFSAMSTTSDGPNLRSEWPMCAQDWEYGIVLSLGTPARELTFIADTGSNVVWLQCKPCFNCVSQSDALYDPASSSSYQAIKCSDENCPAKRSLRNTTRKADYCHSNSSDPCCYKVSYGDGSYSAGVFATETIQLPSVGNETLLVEGFKFGCGHNQSGLFSQMDGLIGLGWGESSLVTQLAPLTGKLFSYCLVPFTDAGTVTSPFILGPISPPATMQYTPFLPNSTTSGFYIVGLESINVGETKIPVPPNSPYGDGTHWTLVDSGTSLTTLNSDVYDTLVKVIREEMQYPMANCSLCMQIGFDPNVCFDVSKSDNVVYPKITLHFTNADLVLPPANSFLQVQNDTVCLTYFRGDDSTKGVGISILGNYQQQNFLFTYDIDQNRLGFVQEQCDSQSYW